MPDQGEDVVGKHWKFNAMIAEALRYTGYGFENT